jgi:hypothetical protein
MDCRMIQGELVAFTFGTSSDDERERIDAHLLGCTECLRAYLRFKHHVERGASLRERPSDETRRRIRDDVAAAVRPHGAARAARWLRRPIPLYQGLAVACVAAGLVVAMPWMHDLLAPHDAIAASRVDSARPVAESISIY